MNWYQYGRHAAFTKLGWVPDLTSSRENERQSVRLRQMFGRPTSIENLQYPEYSLSREQQQNLPVALQQELHRRLQNPRGTHRWDRYVDPYPFRKLGIDFMADGFGNDSRAGLSVGDAGGHQEAVEENDPRPKRMHPSTLSNAPRTTGGPSETISRAFDSHDAIAPKDLGRPHTEYIG